MSRRAAAAATAAVVLVVAACSGDADGAAKQRPRRTTTTSTTAPVPRALLTNLPDPNGDSLRRSSLAVKIENTPEARPQSGLDVADVVYEEVVEGGITRFWAVFNSQAPDHVGPIRSMRRMDPDVVSPLGGVVAYSGGTPDNVALMRQAPVVWVDENNAGNAFYRERQRQAPHNLYGRTDQLWQRDGEPVPPRPLFSYLGDDELFEGGSPVDVFKLGFRAPYDVSYTYDRTTERWKRSYGNVAFMAESGQQVAPTNVVVQFVSYAGTGGDGQLVGDGDAWVFSAGRVVKGRWSKASPTEPTQLVDAFGVPIRLQAGTTWVELLPIGASVSTIPAVP